MPYVRPSLVKGGGTLSSGVVSVLSTSPGFLGFADVLQDGDTVDVVVQDSTGAQGYYPRSIWATSGSALTLGDEEVASGSISDGPVSLWASTNKQRNVFLASDYGGMQNALDAANSAGGGLVLVDPGTWEISETLLIYSNTTLELSPYTTIRRMSTISLMIRNATTGVAGYGANENITIRGGTWDANGTNYVDNVCAIAFGHSKNITVENVKIIDSYGWHAIEYNGVQNGIVRNSVLDGLVGADKELFQIDLMKSASQYPAETEFDDTPCDNILVEGCTFRNAARGVGTHSATDGHPQSRITLLNNVFEDLDQEAIYAEDWEQVIIRNNRFSDIGVGIYLLIEESTTDLENYLIDGNTFINCIMAQDGRAFRAVGVENGAGLNHGVFSNNFIDTVDRHGGGPEFCSHWKIVNNFMTNVERVPFWIYGAEDTLVAGNTVVNVGTYYTPKRGIHIGTSNAGVKTTDRTIIVNNHVEAIITERAVDTIITGNVIDTTLTDSVDAVDSQIYSNFVNGTWTA